MRGRMTGLAVAAAVALLAPGTVAAQGITLGVKGGINVADVDVDAAETFDTDNRTGFVGGAFLRLGLGPVLGIQGEVLYTQKGFETPDSDFGTGTAEFTLNYFQFPLLLSAKLPSPLVRPYAYAGPALAFETSCTLDVEGVTLQSDDCSDLDFDTEDAELSLLLGGGAEVALGGVTLLGELRYDLGLTDIDASDSDDEIKNRTWSILAGLAFPLF